MMKYILILSLFFSVAGFGQGQMFLRATAAGGGPANLLLDDYPGAAAAYAVMKLDNDYAGSCIRIRRDSDNTEQDIGFSGNDIDEASINSFCSGANCFVRTWYDQSGNGNNVTQTTAGNQPKIYDSSTGIVNENGVAALSFSGSNCMEGAGINVGLNDFAVFTVCRGDNSLDWIAWSVGERISGKGGPMLFGNSAGRYRASLHDNSSGAIMHSILLLSKNYNLVTYIGDRDGNSTQYGFNTTFPSGISNIANIAPYSSINLSSGTHKIGCGDFFGMKYWVGTQSALIIYISDQSANRSAIETIINNYFSIY